MKRNSVGSSFISAVGGLFNSPSNSSISSANPGSSVAYRSLSQSSESLSSQESYNSSNEEAVNENSDFIDTEEMPAPTFTPPRENGTSQDSQEHADAEAEDILSDRLIDTVNTLQRKMAACGQTLDPKLPKIAVVGPEESGKTSVLQSFIGRDCLPSGSGLVTRRPTIIQLIPIPAGEREYGVFAHVPKEEGGEVRKFYDFDAIRQEIVDETNRLLGPTSFSSEPIHLEIYSPNVLKLTVVDLPGLVKNKVETQDHSVVSTVRDVVLDNIRDPSTIILAICPANQPLTTSDALEVALQVDPNRERTIGVLTKLDIMDKGTNALDTLENRKIHLKRGYVGVVNRSQLDIQNKRDRAYVLENEKKFFKESPYSHLAYRMGTPYLQRMLQKTLKQHIKNELPSIREDLSLRLSRMEQELKQFEETIGESQTSGNKFYLMRYVNEFIKNVEVDIMGYSDDVDQEQVGTGSFINFKLNTEIKKFIEMDLVPDERNLTILIINLCGLRNSISVPSMSIDALCKRLVNKFTDPLEKTLNTVKDILLDSVVDMARVMDRYPSLKNEVIFQIRSCITKRTDFTRDILLAHIEAEKNCVNVGHPDYDSEACAAIAPLAGCIYTWKKEGTYATTGTSNGTPKPPFGDTTARDQLVTLLLADECHMKRVQYVTQMMSNYLHIVKKSVSDVCIKYITYHLVRKFLEYLNKNLQNDLLGSKNLPILMQDCEEDFRMKAEMEATCTYLQEALDLIQAF